MFASNVVSKGCHMRQDFLAGWAFHKFLFFVSEMFSSHMLFQFGLVFESVYTKFAVLHLKKEMCLEGVIKISFIIDTLIV